MHRPRRSLDLNVKIIGNADDMHGVLGQVGETPSAKLTLTCFRARRR